MKRTLATVLTLVLVAVLSVGATLAFVRGENKNHINVFTSGEDVNVEVVEYFGVEGNGAEIVETKLGENTTKIEYKGVMPGDYLKKQVAVTNKGAAAYVKVTVTMNNAAIINKAIDDTYANAYKYGDAGVQAMYDYIFDGWGLNYAKADAENSALGMRLTVTGDDMPEHVIAVDTVKALTDHVQFGAKNMFISEAEEAALAGGKNYSAGLTNSYYSPIDQNTICWTYYIKLDENESTTLFNGIRVPEEFTYAQLGMFDDLKIDITASAIQADSFASAKDAFEALAVEEAA